MIHFGRCFLYCFITSLIICSYFLRMFRVQTIFSSTLSPITTQSLGSALAWLRIETFGSSHKTARSSCRDMWSCVSFRPHSCVPFALMIVSKRKKSGGGWGALDSALESCMALGCSARYLQVSAIMGWCSA